jgi:coenzyme F420-0:L-glutamate ligase/coenzyme F420-1:gamma-L-glutamate ligase
VLSASAIAGLPEIAAGDDLAAKIVAALAPDQPADGDVIVIAHKVVSKAEGRIRRLPDVAPGQQAVTLAGEQGKDPRLVQVVLDESRAVIRASGGVIVCETRHGFICANAGVDASNVPGDDTVVLLPLDPDASARAIRARIAELTSVRPGIVITDSFGRAWRIGQCDVAIGLAGIEPVDDWRGRADANGRELRATVIAVADELAAAADLARSKDAAEPVVLIRGAERHVRAGDGPGAAAIVRAREHDLFR